MIAAAIGVGDVEVQARKTYVSLLTPKRTFARIQATTKTRLDVALRVSARPSDRRLRASRIHESMPLQVELAQVTDVDAGVRKLLRRAFEENSR